MPLVVNFSNKFNHLSFSLYQYTGKFDG